MSVPIQKATSVLNFRTFTVVARVWVNHYQDCSSYTGLKGQPSVFPSVCLSVRIYILLTIDKI